MTSKRIRQEFAEQLKKEFLPGTRIRLLQMGEDPYPVPPGSLGTVTSVDDLGTIHMRWDCGSSLGLIVDEDLFEVIGKAGDHHDA